MAASSLLWALIALIFPPLPVAIRKGCSGHLILNIVLLLLAWIPAVLHAWYVILEYDSAGQKKIDRRVRRARDEERVGALNRQSAEMEKEKMMGNQYGYYGPVQAAQQPVQPNGMEIRPVEVRQEPPEYARDVKQGYQPEIEQQQAPPLSEYPRDVKQ